MSSFSQILFICTGNYYRSRFAEIYFNHLAEQNNLTWRAFSRGFIPYHLRAISIHTENRLKELKIDFNPNRIAQLLELEDLERATQIIALKEAEHRPLMRNDFPTWENRTEYWHIHDLDAAEPSETLNALEEAIKLLIKKLSI